MKRQVWFQSFLTLVILPLSGIAADKVLFTEAPDGGVIARDSSGVALWKSYGTDSGLPEHAGASGRNSVRSVAMPGWDPLIDLDPSNGAPIAGPIFDSFGNAWVVINDPANLIAIQSNGSTGTWLAPHIIGPSLPTGIDTVGVAVDQVGGFYVTYGTAATEGTTSNPLLWTKYSPTTGWQPATQVYNSGAYFTETFPVIDSAGRLVVVFNANGIGISSIASNPSQSSWGAVENISKANEESILPSVAANKSGSRLALVYLSYTVGQPTLRYTFFNSSTGQWKSPTAISNSSGSTFNSYSTLNAFPITVDEGGSVTLAVPVTVKSNSNLTGVTRPTVKYSANGYRYENGAWSAQQLLAPIGSTPSLDAFAGIALNSNGVVLISVPVNDGSSGTNVTVFRYTPGVGWDTEIAAHYNSPIVSRSKVAWFEGTEAVVVYNASGPLLAALYANGIWGNAAPIPGNPTNVSFPALSGAPTGENLLAIPQIGVDVTWLRP